MNLLRPAFCILRHQLRTTGCRLRHRLRAAGCGLRELGIVLALTLAPVVLLAHAYLLRSSPKAGEKVATAPKQLVLIFSTRIELAVSSVSLWTMDSVAIPLPPPNVHPTERAGVVVDLPALVAQEYRVRWRTTSADGHPIQGSFRFTVLPRPLTDATAAMIEEAEHGRPVDSSSMVEYTEDPDALREGLGGIDIFRTIIRWLSFLAFFAAVGAAAFALLVLRRLEAGAQLPPGVIADITRATRMVGVIAATAVAVLAVPRLYFASAAVMVDGAPTMMKYATSTTTGRALLVQMVAAAIAVLGFMLASEKRRFGPSIAAAGMLGVLFATSYEGHAAAADSPALVGLLTIAHIIASSVWFGMLLVVVAVAIPRLIRSSPERPLPAVATLIGTFSPIALVCGIVAAAAGVVLGVLHVGSVAALLRSDYGRTLLVKVALVSLVFGTGLYNWRRMKPALADPTGSDRLVRSATAELVLGALVLAATAVLVALPSPASLAP